MVVICVSAINAHASIDIFLKIDGIEGENQDSQHQTEIDILVRSWTQIAIGEESVYKILASLNLLIPPHPKC